MLNYFFLVTSVMETGPGVASVQTGELSLMSVMPTITDTVLMSLLGVVPLVTLNAWIHHDTASNSLAVSRMYLVLCY